MQTILTWKLIFGMSLVAIIGCGSDKSPLTEDSPVSSNETIEAQFTPIVDVTPILGTWLLESMIIFNGNEVVQQESAAFPFYLTFKSDSTLKATYNYPIEEFTNAANLALMGLQDVLLRTDKITITVQGEYEIGVNQIRLTFLSASVTPKEAPEIDSDFENPWFFPFIEKVGDSRMLYYTIAEDGSEIVFVAKEGNLRADVIYQRFKTD